MNFDMFRPFDIDSESSRHVQRLAQIGILTQKLDLRSRLDDGRRAPEVSKGKMVIHNRRHRPGIDGGTRVVTVSLFNLFREKAISAGGAA